MIDDKRIDIAQEYFNQAYKLQLEGRLDEAADYYKMSIDVFPTAEAHTFLGWTYSLQNKLQKAIDECNIAIELDEEYGNPYNDIGSYMIKLGNFDEAIPYFEKAIEAPRYVSRHYPYFNLGKVYERKGDWMKAMAYYRQALEINPDYDIAQKAVIRITAMLN